MTVSPDQIAKAAGLKNADIAARVCDEVGTKYYHLCALLEKESGGKNVYGHDVGGTLSGFDLPVNKDNYAVFYWLVITKGGKSNGVGPMQLTYKGFLTDMAANKLKAYDPYDNITYGAKLWLDYYRTARSQTYDRVAAIIRAGTKYNTGSYGTNAYGVRLLGLMNKWVGIVGTEDYR